MALAKQLVGHVAELPRHDAVVLHRQADCHHLRGYIGMWIGEMVRLDVKQFYRLQNFPNTLLNIVLNVGKATGVGEEQ